jgi:pseudaminic acid cytidylyltransferase
MKPIAIIPARGGSKRIPRKNIQSVDGIPMIARAISTALNSQIFKKVVVSTDDEEIAEIARTFGALVPKMRDSHLSDDFATTYDVVADALSESWVGKSIPSHVCCLYPASIFVRESHLIDAYSILTESSCSYVFPVQEFSSPIQRGLYVDEQGMAKMIEPKNLLTRTQDLPITYHDTGQFYWGKTEAWVKKDPIFGPDSKVLLCKPYEFLGFMG